MSGLSRSDIDDIIKLLEASNFDELRLEMGDVTIELRRNGAGPVRDDTGAPAVIPAAVEGSNAPPDAVTRPASPGEGKDVPSPLLGTFYHAPKPGAEVFVKPGDTVTPDTVIGIIEVMKLMNSVTAGIAGTVTEIVAPNGELVEHGETLIRVKRF